MPQGPASQCFSFQETSVSRIQFLRILLAMDLAFQEFIVSAKQIATKPRAQNYTSWFSLLESWIYLHSSRIRKPGLVCIVLKPWIDLHSSCTRNPGVTCIALITGALDLSTQLSIQGALDSPAQFSIPELWIYLNTYRTRRCSLYIVLF
jgi:hypothetical protein